CNFYFFFSSRRRHTRFSRDWSSDVCSSDLYVFENVPNTNLIPWQNPNRIQEDALGNLWISTEDGLMVFDKESAKFMQLQPGKGRSEERRVGKECRDE